MGSGLGDLLHEVEELIPDFGIPSWFLEPSGIQPHDAPPPPQPRLMHEGSVASKGIPSHFGLTS